MKITDTSQDEQIASAKSQLRDIDEQLASADKYLMENQSCQLLVKSFSMIRRDFDQIKLQTNILGQIMDYLSKAEAQEASAQNDLDELYAVGADILAENDCADDVNADVVSSNGDNDSEVDVDQKALEEVPENSENLSIALKEAKETLSKATAEVQRFTRQRDETTATYNRLMAECHERLAPFGITEVSLATVEDIRADLTQRLKAWQDMNAKKQQLLARKQSLETEIQNLSELKSPEGNPAVDTP